MATKLLVIDDEKLIRWSLKEHFSLFNYVVFEAENGMKGWDIIQNESIDVLIVDLKMPKLDGLGLLEKLKDNGIYIPSIVLTAHGDISTAVKATKLGAEDLLLKPFDLNYIQHTVERIIKYTNIIDERDYLRRELSKPYGKLIGSSPTWISFVNKLKKLETINFPMVLLTGETGTGKGLVARTIHEQGLRRKKPFVNIDCTGLPKNLIQSELFGHEKGAFTDAHSRKKGLFEMAQDGTIFLDEIGELDLLLQSKLLHSLEEKTFKRVGATSEIQLRAGIISATNRNLQDDVNNGIFRQDLYYRLNLIHFHVPPLRERKEDICDLAEAFIQNFSMKYGKPTSVLNLKSRSILEQYDWPGNIRELRNVIERIVLLDSPEIIEPIHIPFELKLKSKEESISSDFLLPEEGLSLEDLEKSLIRQSLIRCDGNQTKAAELLNITRFAFRYRLQKYNLMVQKED
jgi:two-component system, NtrC family, response regulator AtoC